ncbi:MAG: hypothetical protein JWP69_1609 [Flaviaesturariibacter sp.]|nr:hypothetical protein [Flaviaesturariibacter sp.]
MLTHFNPNPTDELVQTLYPSGQVQEEKYLRNAVPANGWSRKLYFENGMLQQADCFSHSLLIEQVTYDESGNLSSHKIYSHAKKELIDKPKVTEVIRHNSVSGVAHMGFYYRHLPAISQIIKAEYDEGSLDEAYEAFLEEAGNEEDFDFDKEYSWRLKGETMSFIIRFEKYEGYFQWTLATSSEADYERAKAYMDSLRHLDHNSVNGQ